jgi:multidrug efflux pump subunit AcrA (membrane-fusion protein)
MTGRPGSVSLGLALCLGLGLGVGAAAGCRGGAADEGDLAEPIDIAAPADRVDDRADDKPGFLAALTPKDFADITAPYTSASARLAVKLGDTVTAGQIVARLDDRQLRQELEAGRAQLRTAQANVIQAEVDRRGAEVVLAREKKAEAAGVGSRADLATATQAVAKAGAAVTVARATADERATRLAQLQIHLSEMTLVSPIAGSVALIYAQDGARVEEGHPVLRVISGGVFVKFAIPADKAGSVQPGDRVDLRLDRRSELLTARVGHVAPELDAVAQMIIADADLVDPPADLQPGTVGRILPHPAHPATARPTR